MFWQLNVVQFLNETYKINIFFAGGSIITIISEVIEVALHDLGKPWNVKTYSYT